MAERQGYADFQRTVSWDGEQVLNLHGNTHSAPFTTERFNASRFAYLSGFLTVGLSPCLVTIQWFTEQAAGEAIGQREFVLDPGIPTFGQIHLPHLGPWFQITMKGKGVELYEPQARLFNSNRVLPLEFVPVAPTLLVMENVFAGPGEVTTFPNSYYSGPMRGMIEGSAANEVRLTIQSAISPAVFQDVDRAQQSSVSANGFPLVAPSGAWRVILFCAGAQTVKWRLTPYLTGSS